MLVLGVDLIVNNLASHILLCYGVVVDDAVISLQRVSVGWIVLQVDPVLDGAEIVAQVNEARRLDP